MKKKFFFFHSFHTFIHPMKGSGLDKTPNISTKFSTQYFCHPETPLNQSHPPACGVTAFAGPIVVVAGQTASGT